MLLVSERTSRLPACKLSNETDTSDLKFKSDFYRAMVYAERGDATVCYLSVRR